MPPGGKRENSGRKKSKRPTVKKQFIVYVDQVRFINSLAAYKGSEYVRAAIEEKRIRDYEAGLSGSKHTI